MFSRAFTEQLKPVYSFIGGVCYDTSSCPTTSSPYAAKSYSGENYAYFRLFSTLEETKTFRSTMYANLPMVVLQHEAGAVGYVFEPLADGKPYSIALSSDNDTVSVDFRSDVKHALKQKSSCFLGHWESETECAANLPVPPVQRVTATHWTELVRNFVSARIGDPVTPESAVEALQMVSAFYNRAFDAVRGIHVDTLSSELPSDFGDPIYSYPSFEACRLSSLSRIDKKRTSRWQRIADLLLGDVAAVNLTELGDVRAWHNAIKLDDKSGHISFSNAYGTGYSGWPGGMAYTIRGLANYSLFAGRKDTYDRIRSGLNWLLAIQQSDGSFPFNVPTFTDLCSAKGCCATGPQSHAVGGAAEAVRALCTGYKLLDNERYLRASEVAISTINPAPPFYAFRGYGDLRDAGDYETDATSGCSLGQANLDLFELTGKKEYVETAKALGYYLLTWHFWWTPGPREILGLIDPMAESFSPHASPWSTALAAEFYCRLYHHTRDDFWLKTAHYVYGQCLHFQNRVTGGVSETYPIKLDGCYTGMGGESAMVSWALIDGGLAVLESLGISYETAYDPEPGIIETSISCDAQVVLSRPYKTRISMKKVCRQYVKVLAKGFWKKLPMSIAYRLSKAAANPPAAFAGLPPGLKPYRTIHLGVGESLGEISCIRASEGGITLSAALPPSKGIIKKVFFPVLTFPSDVRSVEVSDKIGETITTFRVRTDEGCYDIRFLPGTDGLGVSDVKAEGDRVLCDATLKALWQRGGVCSQRISITRSELETGT